MKNIILALLIVVAPSIFAYAGEWALVNSSGVVVQVIEASYAITQDRSDGPWIKTAPQKVGVGYTWSGSSFTAIYTSSSAIHTH